MKILNLLEQLILFFLLLHQFPPVAANAPLKLPDFWPDAAEVWFDQADAQLAIKTNTVSKTKFYHAVASLLQDVAAQILDLI